MPMAVQILANRGPDATREHLRECFELILAITLPAALGSMIGQGTTEWGSLNAAGVLTTIPVVVFFLFFQRYLVQGLTEGAVKG